MIRRERFLGRKAPVPIPDEMAVALVTRRVGGETYLHSLHY